MTPPDEHLEVGYVCGVHGVRGAILVQLHDPRSEALSSASTLILRSPDDAAVERAYRVRAKTSVPSRSGRWRVELHEIDDRDRAEALRGSTLLVSREALPPLEEDEYYLADLMGREVVREDAPGHLQGLGVVVGLMSNGAQDLLEIEWIDPSGRAQRWLLPALPGFVLDVDPQRVRVDVPHGMLPDALEVS